MSNKEYFTLIIDSPIINAGTGIIPVKFLNTLAAIEHICKNEGIPFYNLYVEKNYTGTHNGYAEFEKRQTKIGEIHTKLKESSVEGVYKNIGYYIIICNTNENDVSFYKFNPNNNLGLDVTFKDIRGKSDLLDLVNKSGNFDNITKIVIEYPFNVTIEDIQTPLLPPSVKFVNFFESLISKYGAPKLWVAECEKDKPDIIYKLERKYFTKDFTLGILYKNDEFFCYTAEDTVRFSTNDSLLFDPNKSYPFSCQLCKDKILHETAIPCGTYFLRKHYSGKLKGNYPRLYSLGAQEVPCYYAILMHGGSGAGSSSGCIILGSQINKESGGISGGRALAINIHDNINNNCIGLKITQKIGEKDLSDDEINRIRNGEKLGDI